MHVAKLSDARVLYYIDYPLHRKHCHEYIAASQLGLAICAESISALMVERSIAARELLLLSRVHSEMALRDPIYEFRAIPVGGHFQFVSAFAVLLTTNIRNFAGTT